MDILEIAKVFGQPIDAALPVPFEISEICELDTAECGEDYYYFDEYDTTSPDIIYTALSSGELTSIKKSMVSATPLPLTGKQSDLTYITLDDLQNSKDKSGLGRVKASITRAMDKNEIKTLLDTILAIASQEVELATADDIYSGIIKMVHKVVDFGDNYVLLCGTSVWEAINTYEKDKIETNLYRLGIKEMLKEFGITLIRVSGTVALDTTSAEAPVLAATKAILVARNSKLVKGKPCLFVRRVFSPEISAQLGIGDEGATRIITSIGGLQVLNNNKNILGYGVVGYTSTVTAVTNYLAMCHCDELTSPA